jgi:tRNA pseudouridine38-40 synthase
MRNLKLTIEYDGTDFCGWQRQAHERTVQAEIEHSLFMLTEEKVTLTAAGRTDAGVHALGQVANFKTNSRLPLQTFVRGGNSRLPRDVRIISAEDVHADFNARYSAKARTYRYYIAKRQQAVGRYYAWYYWNPLNLQVMRDSCRTILGTHDFSGFCRNQSDREHYLCDVRYASWNETNDLLIFEICANRFLHNMVRILVGSMVAMGDPSRESKPLDEILQGGDRREAGATAPALGLFLVQVEY